ncbi:hypothetical protein H257_01393 [Aphanomyces astaci]|uniref:CHCH domain-containing protein n=1 Tax=Aphanomyces astaci TaxID=112090 RepID=W4HA72_APHAT|nr:hypothetical protein H257_01393 [Aphanomyces astaci]ETV88008.1 hypothetical protein H257_01393 [Aphanomyces astaci]|eukprot:XP_009822871.1 hypothetical protein H257_01393 [Aphanomyces astaci]
MSTPPPPAATPPLPVMASNPGQWEMGECTELQKASLKCIEENYTKRSNCNEHFERYRECKKKRHASIVAARRAGILD